MARLVVTTTLADGEYTDSQSQSQRHRSPDTRNQPNLIGAAGVQIAYVWAHTGKPSTLLSSHSREWGSARVFALSHL